MDKCRCIAALAFTIGLLHAEQAWQPDTDWSHWRLGHRTDLEWLQTNRLTITFGSGAPNFESLSRAEFDREMDKAKAFNRSYHERGYIVLRYLSSSLDGDSGAPDATPRKEQIGAFRFYDAGWDEYQDYIGPKPKEDPRNWITVRADGTFPFYRYAPYGKKPGRRFETWGCPNNPDYARMMEGRIRAQAETGIDGSYVDWTQVAGGTCYCEYCRRNFIAYLEEHLPREAAKVKYGTAGYQNVHPPEKRGEPFWMEWIAFRAHTVAEFHRRLRTVARKYNPHFMISGNVFGGFGYGPIAYDAAGDVELLGREGYDDFIYSEIQEFLDSAPRRTAEGVKITNSPALKYLAAVTHGKPVIVYATEITPPIFPDPTEKCLSAMAQINIAEAAANHTVFREKRETPAGATRMYQFLAGNEPRLRTANLHANVAVLASVQQYLADELSFAFSTSRVLADRGIAHVMAPLDDAAGGLDDYGVVVVPYLPLLSPTRQEALLGYARRGGRLLVLGASGVKDEYNVPQTNVPLARALGGSAYPAGPRVRKLGRGEIRFLPLPIPAARFLISMKAKGDYTTFGPTMADRFADIPEGYTRNRIDPALRRILESAADQVAVALGGRLTRLARPSPYVEMTAMLTRAKERMLVHLVNYDVTVDGDITPARNVDVDVAPPPGKTVRSVEYSGALGALEPVRFARAGKAGTVRFTAGELGVYGLAIVELR